jgi:hypothetical protein
LFSTGGIVVLIYAIFMLAFLLIVYYSKLSGETEVSSAGKQLTEG